MSCPRAKASFEGKFLNCSDSSTVLRYTDWGSLLGTSIPTAAFPGMGASILMPLAARLSAMSSARFTILLTFTPWLGETSYLVTVGPLFICITLASTPKLFNVSSSFFAVASIYAFEESSPETGAFASSDMGGNS